MLEEALSITRRHRVEGSTHCLYERLASARPGFAHQRHGTGHMVERLTESPLLTASI